MNKYIFSNFKNSKEYKLELLNKLKNLSNIEVGGNRLYDGYKNHLTQNPLELTELIFFLKNHQKKNNLNLSKYLEIGFYSGFTNTILNKFFKFEDIVVIDNLSEEIDANNFLANLKFKNITLIVGSSQDRKTINKASKFLKYDLFYIDGNHSYNSVKKDFYNYYDLIRTKGVILIHDIINKDWPGVKKFFGELKKNKKFTCKEIIQKGNKINYGIGIVIKND
tara:strand:- start:6903 stop:7568 length:666 start_codon:yes stop_codon:yes gene_type:complete